ncbi:MAG: hypothetical protein IPP49_00435 [Saprospiraceae bacterium]|nr:hypothetical protein [Saprospiraceae bacterium]
MVWLADFNGERCKRYGTTAGVRGISLGKDDKVISMVKVGILIQQNVVVGENGTGKKEVI